MAINETLENTISLFWTEHHLTEFQKAWDNQDYDSNWTVKIHQQNIEFKH